MKIPLFPLNTVLFPTGRLQLRLFEPRYLDMVSRCLRSNSGFGVCLIRKGNEVGKAVDFFAMGTYATITDWDQMDDGLLGISVSGERRFRVKRSEIQQDKLCLAEVSWFDDNEQCLPVSYQGFADLLKEIANRYQLSLADEHFGEANWVSQRLAELLPFDMSVRQTLLEMDCALNRFDYMQELLEEINAGE